MKERRGKSPVVCQRQVEIRFLTSQRVALLAQLTRHGTRSILTDAKTPAIVGEVPEAELLSVYNSI